MQPSITSPGRARAAIRLTNPVPHRRRAPIVIGTAAFIGVPESIKSIFAGFLVLGVQSGINVVGALIYPTSLRANGSGWELGIGRLGSIVGPLLGSLFVAHAGAAALSLVGAPLRRRRRRLLRDPPLNAARLRERPWMREDRGAAVAASPRTS